MSYVIAAYAVVVGSLVAYGVWIQFQRRALARNARSASRGAPPSEGGDSDHR